MSGMGQMQSLLGSLDVGAQIMVALTSAARTRMRSFGRRSPAAPGFVVWLTFTIYLGYRFIKVVFVPRFTSTYAKQSVRMHKRKAHRLIVTIAV